MSIDDINFNPDDPSYKLGNRSGGRGGGTGGSGPGPAGGFLAYAGGGPGFSSGGYDFGTATGNSRAAILKRIMDAIASLNQPQMDSVDIKGQPGEYMLNAPAAALAGKENLDALNGAGNEVRHMLLGGAVGLLDSVGASTSTGAGAATAAVNPIMWVPAALEAVKFVSGLLGKQDGGPNGLERARAMGYDPQQPQHMIWGGTVKKNPYGTPYGAPAGTPEQGGVGRPSTSPMGGPSVSGTGTGSSDPTRYDPGSPNPPTSWYDQLIKDAQARGAFDPNYGMDELSASLARQNQGAQAADVRDLMASGLDDPSLYASQLLASRSARSKDASQALANARLSQTQQYQQWIDSLLAARHSDQIAELLARIK